MSSVLVNEAISKQFNKVTYLENRGTQKEVTQNEFLFYKKFVLHVRVRVKFEWKSGVKWQTKYRISVEIEPKNYFKF